MLPSIGPSTGRWGVSCRSLSELSFNSSTPKVILGPSRAGPPLNGSYGENRVVPVLRRGRHCSVCSVYGFERWIDRRTPLLSNRPTGVNSESVDAFKALKEQTSRRDNRHFVRYCQHSDGEQCLT